MVSTSLDASSMESAALRLHAAGDDVDALKEAVDGAAFLDSVPGDFRQKLRGVFLYVCLCVAFGMIRGARLSLADSCKHK